MTCASILSINVSSRSSPRLPAALRGCQFWFLNRTDVHDMCTPIRVAAILRLVYGPGRTQQRVPIKNALSQAHTVAFSLHALRLVHAG